MARFFFQTEAAYIRAPTPEGALHHACVACGVYMISYCLGLYIHYMECWADTLSTTHLSANSHTVANDQHSTLNGVSAVILDPELLADLHSQSVVVGVHEGPVLGRRNDVHILVGTHVVKVVHVDDASSLEIHPRPIGITRSAMILGSDARGPALAAYTLRRLALAAGARLVPVDRVDMASVQAVVLAPSRARDGLAVQRPRFDLEPLPGEILLRLCMVYKT